MADKYLMYSIFSCKLDCSNIIEENRANHEDHRPILTHLKEVVLTVLYIAMKEMNTKKKSINIHQSGTEDDEQQLFEQADAININGVAIQ